MHGRACQMEFWGLEVAPHHHRNMTTISLHTISVIIMTRIVVNAIPLPHHGLMHPTRSGRSSAVAPVCLGRDSGTHHFSNIQQRRRADVAPSLSASAAGNQAKIFTVKGQVGSGGFLYSLAEPCGDLIFCERARCNGFHHANSIRRIELQAIPMLHKKQARHDPGCAFVAIDKVVIADKSISIRRCQRCCIRLAIRCLMLRTRHRGLQCRRIAHAPQAAMLCQLSIMRGMEDIQPQPSPSLHFASARRISLSSCMISSAKRIWRSKSGLYGVRR